MIAGDSLANSAELQAKSRHAKQSSDQLAGRMTIGSSCRADATITVGDLSNLFEDYWTRKLEPRVDRKMREMMHGVLDVAAKDVLLGYNQKGSPQHIPGENESSIRIQELKTNLERKERLLEECSEKQRKLQEELDEAKSNLECRERSLGSCLEMQHKLQEEVEEVKSLQSVCSTGSYAEGAPSPPMLREALDAVKAASCTCARRLFAEVKKHLTKAKQNTGHTNWIMFKNGGSSAVARGLPPLPFHVFEDQLCQIFFYGFESLGCHDPILSTAPFFEKPNDLKLRLFKEFEDYKAIDEHSLLQLDKQTRFAAFLKVRIDMFVKRMEAAPFADASQRESCLSSMLEAGNAQSIFLDFAALGKAVWLLQKLAFAFQPTAEIFRVAGGSLYDPAYMQDMEPEHDQADPGKSLGSDHRPPTQYLVDFMAVPGFTVRNLTLNAHVYLRKGPDHRAC